MVNIDVPASVGVPHSTHNLSMHFRIVIAATALVMYVNSIFAVDKDWAGCTYRIVPGKRPSLNFDWILA